MGFMWVIINTVIIQRKVYSQQKRRFWLFISSCLGLVSETVKNRHQWLTNTTMECSVIPANWYRGGRQV
jgi:hypothetical protein